MSSPGAPSAGPSTPPNYSSGPSTPPSYSLGPSTPTNYSSRSSRNAKCSNCKHLRGSTMQGYDLDEYDDYEEEGREYEEEGSNTKMKRI
nr:hypothetical protein [Tanacetum cinerariifolium]